MNLTLQPIEFQYSIFVFCPMGYG